MATSAFKSTSRRTSSSTTNPVQSAKQKQNDRNQKAPIRRSRSVSASSRTQLDVDVTFDFHNKRDNPLFWVDDGDSQVKLSEFDEVSSKAVNTSSVQTSNSFLDSGRGRTVSRSSTSARSFSVVGNGGRSNSGRSLSRVDTGRSLSRVDTGRRRRLPSRGRHGNLQREREQDSGFSSDARSKYKISSNCSRGVSLEKKKSVGSASDLSEVLKSWNTWSSQHPVPDTADDSPRSLSGSQPPRWEDGGSTGSISEVEEKTIIPVSEVKKTSARSSPEILHSRILSDFAPEAENSDVEELLRDFREDFARELEECEERSRKLRAELAAEEHRELELSKILSDVSETMTPQVQKPRGVKKASVERRKMSKRLEEEAMAYFDECVSISTFDDSDFSSLEDPTSYTTGADGVYPSRIQDLRQGQLMQCAKDSGLASNTSCNDSPIASSLSSSKMKTQSAVTRDPSVSISLEQDLKNYVKSFSKEHKRESSNSNIAQTACASAEECRFQAPVEQLLLDRAIFRSRIESGCMLLCGASFALPGAPFA